MVLAMRATLLRRGGIHQGQRAVVLSIRCGVLGSLGELVACGGSNCYCDGEGFFPWGFRVVTAFVTFFSLVAISGKNFAKFSP